MKAPVIPKIALPQPTVRTVTAADGSAQYHVIYRGSVVASLKTAYEAQRYVDTIVNPINPV